MKEFDFRIKIIRWNLLSLSTKDRLLNLTLKGTGCMRHFALEVNPIVFDCFDKKTGKRMGWGAYDDLTGWTMMFVDPTHRRKGIASFILEHVINYVRANNMPKIRINKWDWKSRNFYDNYYRDDVEPGHFSEVEQYHQRNYKWQKR